MYITPKLYTVYNGYTLLKEEYMDLDELQSERLNITSKNLNLETQSKIQKIELTHLRLKLNIPRVKSPINIESDSVHMSITFYDSSKILIVSDFRLKFNWRLNYEQPQFNI